MKKYFLMVLVYLSFWAVSCVKDKGNYKYVEVQDLTIAGIDSFIYKEVDNLPLVINPTVKDKNGNPIVDSNYTFEWAYYGKPNYTIAITPFNNTKELNVSVSTAFKKVGRYKCYYRVRNKSTGIYSDVKFEILVGSKIYEGWLALCEKNDGTSRLDMVSLINNTKDSLIQNVLGYTKSVFPLNSPPVSITYASASFNDATDGEGAPLIITNRNASYLTSDSFKYQPNYEIQNNSKYIFPDYTGINVVNRQRYEGLVSYAGNLMPIRTGMLGKKMAIDNPVNIFNKVRYKASPYIASPHNTYFSSYIVYADDLHSFLRFANAATDLSCLALPAGTLFNFQDTTKQLIYMDYTDYDGGYVVAILKNIPNGDYYYARFSSRGVQKYYDKLNISNVNNIDKIAFDPTYGYMMYTTKDNRLFEYDPIYKTTTEMANYGNNKISLLKYHVFDYYTSPDKFKEDLQKKLIVCTYNESDKENSGNIYLYSVPSLHADLETYKHFTGLGKIVSLTYKYQ